MPEAEMEKATSQWCTSSERIFYASLFTPSINAHSVHSFFSTLYPSGNGLSQHFLPHPGQIVSCQSGSLGRGTFFLNGIIRIPLPSVRFLGSTLICILLFPSFVCMGSNAIRRWHYSCFQQIPYLCSFVDLLCSIRIPYSSPDDSDAVWSLPHHHLVSFPIISLILAFQLSSKIGVNAMFRGGCTGICLIGHQSGFSFWISNSQSSKYLAFAPQ